MSTHAGKGFYSFADFFPYHCHYFLPIRRLSDLRKQHHFWCCFFLQQYHWLAPLPAGCSPEVGVWFTALGVSSMAINLNGFNNPPIGGNSSLNSSLVGKVKV
jgi:hypothetical protein